MTKLQHTDLSMRLVLAAAENMPSDVLHQLATDSALEVRQAVAGNPNTPIETLFNLGKEFPDEITANPIFSIQLLAEPESHFVQLSLARSSKTSENILNKLSNIPNEEILCAVAQNLATPTTILEKLVRHTPKFYHRDDSDGSEYKRLFSIIAKHPNTSVESLTRLAALTYLNISSALAENPNTPLCLLNEFAIWRNLETHRALLRNPKLPVSILEILAAEDNQEIRLAVKVHPNVSQTAIDICDFVEGKPETPVYILEKLASDRSYNIKSLVARHRDTPVLVLQKMLADYEPKTFYNLSQDYRWFIINNPNLPAETLAELTEKLFTELNSIKSHQSRRFRYDLQEDFNCLTLAFLAIARHPHTSPENLHYLTKLDRKSRLDVDKILKAIAANHNTYPQTLIKIGRICLDSSKQKTVKSLGTCHAI
jgi:hypothetical protein